MINDITLIELSKALNGEVFITPSHTSFGSTSTILTPATSTLPGELDRSLNSNSRLNNRTTFISSRSGVAVITPGGDRINNIGLWSAASAGSLFASSLVPSILHSSTYDLEVNWNIFIERK